jgi:hypothetical protein
MKCAIEMGSGAMMYMMKFYEDWFRHSKVDKGIHRHRQHGDRISLPFFFQKKERTLKTSSLFSNKMRLTCAYIKMQCTSNSQSSELCNPLKVRVWGAY